jgi:hypothetical protein
MSDLEIAVEIWRVAAVNKPQQSQIDKVRHPPNSSKHLAESRSQLIWRMKDHFADHIWTENEPKWSTFFKTNASTKE